MTEGDNQLERKVPVALTDVGRSAKSRQSRTVLLPNRQSNKKRLLVLVQVLTFKKNY